MRQRKYGFLSLVFATALLAMLGCGGGGSSSSGSTLPVTSAAPTVAIQGWTPADASLLQYTAYTFSASATDPNIGGTITEFQWDFGDGTRKTVPAVLVGGKATASVVYSYVTSGTPTLSVVAKNAAGLLSTTATRALTVTAAPSPLTVTFAAPAGVLTINPPLAGSYAVTFDIHVVNTGTGTVSASGIALDAGDATASLAAAVSLGSGDWRIVVTYPAAAVVGTRIATPTVKVTDSNGLSSSVVTGPAITVRTVSSVNNPPVVTLTATPKIPAGTNSTWQNVAIEFKAVATDVDGDTLTYSWTFGDAAAAGDVTPTQAVSALTQTHTYVAAGVYPVVFTANDGRAGGLKTITLNLNILANAAPVLLVTWQDPLGAANATSPYANVVLTFNATATDSNGDPVTLTWDFGDGTTPKPTGLAPMTQPHAFQAVGSTQLSITADDGKGGMTTWNSTLIVKANLPPTTKVTTPAAHLYQNKVYTFAASATDPDAGDSVASYEWDFGDGVVVAGTASPAHVFPTTVSGPVNVKARAIDSRGAVGDWSPAVVFTVDATNIPIVKFLAGDKATFNATKGGNVVANFLISVTNPNGVAGAYLPASALTVTAGDPAGTVQTIIDHLDGTYTVPVKYLAASVVGTREVMPTVVATDGLLIFSETTQAVATVSTVLAVDRAPLVMLTTTPAIATAYGPNATWQGVAVTFKGTMSDGDLDPLSYAWTFGDTAGAGDVALTPAVGGLIPDRLHTYLAPGVYPAKLSVDDGRGGVKSMTVEVNVLPNAAPVVSAASAPASPYAYQFATLTASVTDADGDTPEITWDFGDGIADKGNPVIHQFKAVQPTTVTVTANDGKGGVTSNTLLLAIQANRPPTILTVAPLVGTVYNHRSYTLNATVSVPGSNPVSSYEWFVGAGVALDATKPFGSLGTVTAAAALPYSFLAGGTFFAQVRAQDSLGSVGDWGPATAITVQSNGVPTITFVSALPATTLNTEVGSTLGATVVYKVAVTNPNGAVGTYLPVASVSFNAGDTAASITSGVSNGDGTYTFTVKYNAAASASSRTANPSVAAVTDAQLVTGQPASGPAVTIVTQAANHPPVATLTSTAAISAGVNATYQGVEVTFTGTGTDADNDPMSYAWDFGDGSTATGGLVQKHVFANPNAYAVKFTVNDGRTNGIKIADLTMNVLANNAPTANLTKLSPVTNPYKYQRVSLNSGAADVDGDALTATWNYGDGSPTETGVTAVHAFKVAGLTTVTVTVTDGKGGSVTKTLALTVQENNPPVASIASAVVPADAPLKQNKVYTFTATATDPEGDAISGYEWDFGDGVVVPGTASQAHEFRVPVAGEVLVHARAIDAKQSVGDWSPAVTFTVAPTAVPTVTFLAGDGKVFHASVGGSVVANYLISVANPNGAGFLPVGSIVPTSADGTVGTLTAHGDGTYTLPVTYTAAASAGSRAVALSVTATDLLTVAATTAGASTVTTVPATPANVAPTARLVAVPSIATPYGPNATWQNVPVTFKSTVSDVDSDPLSYALSFSDGGTGDISLTPSATGAIADVAHTFAGAAGVYPVKLSVADGRGVNTETTIQLQVLANAAPLIPSLTPTTAVAFQYVTLTATVTDADGDVPVVSFDLGDGSPLLVATKTGANTYAVTHQYYAVQVAQVTVTANDGKGGVKTATFAVTVTAGTAPTILSVAALAAPVYNHRQYTLTATAATGSPAVTQYEWHIGAGLVLDPTVPPVPGNLTVASTLTYTFMAGGVYVVQVRGIDAAGLVGDWGPATAITVQSNGVPTITFVSALPATTLNTEVGSTLGATVVYKVAVTNPNGAVGTYLPVASVSFNAGDTAASITSGVSNGDGTYTFTVKYNAAASASSRTANPSVAAVTDAQLVTGQPASGPAVTIVTQAANNPPVVTLTSAPKIAAGTNATWPNVDVVFTGTATDPDSDPLTYTWDFGDGTVLTGLSGASALTQTHKYPSSLTATLYSVKLTVDDGRTNGIKIADLTMNVLGNAAPLVVVTKVSPSGNPTKYQRVTLNAAVTDTDTTTVTWNFGDGSAAANGTSVVHQFLVAGLTNVTATADDGKGGVTTSAVLPLTIVENNPPVAAVSTATTPANTGFLYQNLSYGFSATASDPDVSLTPPDTIASYEWDFGNGVVVAGGSNPTHSFPATVTGAVAVRARAIDSRGAVGDWSPAVTFTVVATPLPVVTFTSPGVATILNVDLSPATVTQAFTFTVTNPRAGSGATDPIPVGRISFDPKYTGASVISSVSNGGGSYTFTVQYPGAAAANTPTGLSGAPTVYATDSLDIQGLPTTGPLMTIKTLGANHAPTITITDPATPTSSAYTSKPISFGFTLKDADSDPVTYTVDWGDGTSTSMGTPTGDFVAGVPVSLAHTYADAYTSTSKAAIITVSATDNRSLNAAAVTQTRTFTVTFNTLPTATITSPQDSGTAPAGYTPTTLPADTVVVPLNGRLSFAGTSTKPGSQDAIASSSWSLLGGVPSTYSGDTPGDVIFAGTSGVITPNVITYTVTDAFGRSVSKQKTVLVDGVNTQQFNLSFQYRLKSETNGTASLTPVLSAGNGLGASVQIFQDGQSNTYAVQDQAQLAGSKATVSIPVRSDLPFYIKIPGFSGAADATTYMMRIPNAPTGTYADPSLVATPTADSHFSFANGAHPFNPTLQIVTAQGFAAESTGAAQRKLNGFTNLVLGAAPPANERWLDRLSVPKPDPSNSDPAANPIQWTQSSNAVGQLSGIPAYQLFAEWPTLLLTRATADLATGTGAEAIADPTISAGDSGKLGFVLDYSTYGLGTLTHGDTYAAFSMQAFRVPAGFTDPYQLSPAWQNATAQLANPTSANVHVGLNPVQVDAGVSSFFNTIVNTAPGSTKLAGGIASLPLPYDPNDPDRTPLSLGSTPTRTFSNIRSIFAYSEYLWSTVWARPLVLNSARPYFMDSLDLSAFPYFRYSSPTAWPKASGISPDNSAFDLTARGGGIFNAVAPVAVGGGTPPATGVGRFFWTAFTPSYTGDANSGAVISRTWLADDSTKQPPTGFPAASASGDATAAFGLMPPQDTIVDKRGRTATGALSGSSLGGYRVTWYNPTKDASGNPVAPDFWVVELIQGGVKTHFMLPGSYPAATQSTSDLILTDARTYLPSGNAAIAGPATGDKVGPGYCWFDIPLELRPTSASGVTLTVFGVKSILKNNPVTGARALNRPDWMDAIKTATATIQVKASSGNDLAYAHKIPFNYCWDVVVVNGPATSVAP